MGIVDLEERLLRNKKKKREQEYKEQLKRDTLDKLAYVCLKIIPATICAIFDPTVRTIKVDIIRPKLGIKDVTVSDIEDAPTYTIANILYREKAAYFEDLIRWN